MSKRKLLIEVDCGKRRCKRCAHVGCGPEPYRVLGPRGVVLADGLTAGEWWDRLNACEGTALAVDSRGMVLATHGPAALQMQAQARRSNDELCARLGECEWTVSYRKAVA